MGRKIGAWYRTSHKQWFTTIAGKQIPLGIQDMNDRPAAEVALQAILTTMPDAPTLRVRPQGRTPLDPLHFLQMAALAYGRIAAPGASVGYVAIYDAAGVELVRVILPTPEVTPPPPINAPRDEQPSPHSS
jgi:hypothetical protein